MYVCTIFEEVMTEVIIQPCTYEETEEEGKNADLCHMASKVTESCPPPQIPDTSSELFLQILLYTDENVTMLQILFLLPTLLLI